MFFEKLEKKLCLSGLSKPKKNNNFEFIPINFFEPVRDQNIIFDINKFRGCDTSKCVVKVIFQINIEKK